MDRQIDSSLLSDKWRSLVPLGPQIVPLGVE